MELFVILCTRLYKGVLPPVEWSIVTLFTLFHSLSFSSSPLKSLKSSAQQGVEFKLSPQVFKFMAFQA